jgi:GTP-binding protein HflX
MEFRADRRHNLKSAQMAREAAAPKEKTETTDRFDLPGLSTFSVEESLAELRELATSAGATIAGEIIQRRDRPDPATLIGSGKVQEIAGAAGMAHADVVLFDHDLSPSQQRNIERSINARVLDRTQLILDIFARHARTREGQLQVELADRARPSSKQIEERFTAASVTSKKRSKRCGASAASSGREGKKCRSRRSRWSATPTPANQPFSTR